MAGTNDMIEKELLEIETVLQDARLKDEDRMSLHAASQALQWVLDPETWQPPSQTFYRIGARPSEAAGRVQ